MPENIKYTGAPTQTPEEARRTAAIPEYRLEFPQVRLSRAAEEAGMAVGQATKELGATMYTLGRSVDSLGQHIAGAGNEMWDRAIGIKRLEAETKVNNATIAWEQGQTKRDEEFRSKSGAQANSGALEAHLKASEEDRQKIRNSFTSQYEQKLFDQQTTSQYIRSARSAAAHAGQETKTEARHAIDAKIGLKINSIASSKEDADAKTGLAELARIWNDEKRNAYGYSDIDVKRGYMIDATKAIAARAERVASEGDPAHGMKILEDNKAELDEVDSNIYRVAYDKVRAEDNRVKSRVIADKATGDVDESLDVKLNAAHEELKRIGRDNPQDPLFEMTESRVRNKDSVDRLKRQQDREQSYEFVNNAFHGRMPGQNGKGPTTPEEAMAVPGMEEMWPKLTPQQQNAFQAVMKANARGNFDDTAETRAIHKHWAGMFALDKDEMRRKYKEDPLWIDKLPIPENFRRDLENKEIALLSQGIKADEKEAHAKTVFSRGLEEGLIQENMTKPQKALLTHYIDSEIKAWRALHPQKLPTREDEDNFIKSARRQIQQPGTWWGETWPSTVEEYQRNLKKLPNDEYNKARKAYLDLHKGASEEEVTKAIMDAYVLRKLRAEGGAAPAPTPTAIPTKPVKATTVTPGG